MQDMIFCDECGQKLPTTINFCPYCGNKLPDRKKAAEIPPVNNLPASPKPSPAPQTKPVLTSLGISRNDPYTYEYYRANSAEEAKRFLDQTEVTKPLYYVVVETPQGNWGRDKDGMFLEQLCDFQRNLSLAQCEAKTDLTPFRIADLAMCANHVTDNFLLGITCGDCDHHWIDGVAYKTKTIVRCPHCGKYNLANTDNIHCL